MTRRHLRAIVAVLVALVAGLASRRAAAEEAPTATFAFIIGSNASVDAELAPLKYADDDAARYLDLFRLLGARTYLLTRLDDNTRRLHPQAAAEAMEPRRASLDAAVTQLAADVRQAASRNVETVVYFIYAGHGNVRDGRGYITLEDMRLDGGDVARIFAKVPAKRIHLIADACASYFLAYHRGPGGKRRAIEGLSTAPELTADARVGLLLSTSSARESHEWEAFQSGVFSHEIRSGLYGAADADGDGRVSYREIAAFVARANAAVPNERYRPDVHARAPREGDDLVDIRAARHRRIDVDGKHAAHYFLEDARGVRLADVHNAPGQTLSLLRPAPSGPVYLRRLDDEMDVAIPAAPDVVSVAELEPEPARVASRGAAHQSFSALFSLPFDRSVVAAFQEPPVELGQPPPPPPPRSPDAPRSDRARRTRRNVGLGALGASAVALGTGAYLYLSAEDLRKGVPLSEPHADIVDRNQSISRKNTGAAISFAVAGAGLVSGAVLLLWPSAPAAKGVKASVLPGGGFVGYGASF